MATPAPKPEETSKAPQKSPTEILKKAIGDALGNVGDRVGLYTQSESAEDLLKITLDLMTAEQIEAFSKNEEVIAFLERYSE